MMPREEMGQEEAALCAPIPLVPELRIEASIVPHRRGELYGLAADRIERLTARLEAAVAVLDAITTPDGALCLPTDPESMARLEAAFLAAKEVA